jgi:hypothetical protein
VKNVETPGAAPWGGLSSAISDLGPPRKRPGRAPALQGLTACWIAAEGRAVLRRLTWTGKAAGLEYETCATTAHVDTKSRRPGDLPAAGRARPAQLSAQAPKFFPLWADRYRGGWPGLTCAGTTGLFVHNKPGSLRIIEQKDRLMKEPYERGTPQGGPEAQESMQVEGSVRISVDSVP